MARSDEAEWWFNAVYGAVQEVNIPIYHHFPGLMSNKDPLWTCD